MLRKTRIIGLVVFCTMLAACGQQPGVPGMKIGKPYVVDGTTYYPSYNDSYDRIGQASWYGPGFHGKYTANGEVFNQNDLTAAHPTLPMPSLVRVTNLETGKSLIVRINDRGPFKRNRIIDLSRASAQELGIRSTARVRVQFLKDETEKYITSLQSPSSINMAKINEDAQERAKQVETAQAQPPSGQIVESTVSETHAGQTVTDAAPVLTVSSGELSNPPANKPITVADNAPLPHAKKITLVKEAVADDNVEQPTADTAQNEPADSNIKFNPNETETDVDAPAEKPEPVKTHKTAAAKKPAAKPVDEAAPSASGHFIIQAGAYASEENAKKLVARMAGTKAVINKVETGDKTWWRVHVGPFDDRQEAEEALEKVHKSGAPDAKIANK